MTSDIIAKLEKVPEGSRELDALVGKAIGYAGLGEVSDQRAIEAVAAADRESILTIGEVTTSLDAKLPWENIVRVAIFEMKGKIKCDATHWDEATKTATLGTGHTEPLARRCAALKAWEESHE
ncbi:hypothetical protein LCGC14_0231120 [marine sediment metagenome]|uniref:Uncharacterized protein n=1 Tax=marine sediment metagenome TaxID=412755 RepID=A0A0F9U9Y2_9ZZZZ